MKRIICLIVAALLLLSLSASFIGCEDETVEESSQAAESKTESSLTEESKLDESSTVTENSSTAESSVAD